MEIKDIHIDGFGTFRNHTITDLQPGVNIFYGPNEAGKTTLLQFIRMTLFGYAHFEKDRYPPVHGGKHGGRISLRRNNGQQPAGEYIVYRSGKRDFKLIADGQEFTNDQKWKTLISHASEELYNNVYAITLEELKSIDMLSESGMEDRIYSMGLGLSNVNIREVQQSLTNYAEQFYKKSGSKQKLPTLKNEIKDLEQEIRAAEIKVQDYDHLKHERKRIQGQLDDLKQNKEANEREIHKKTKVLQGLERISEYESAKRIVDRHKGLAEIPESSQEQIRESRSRVNTLQEQKEVLVKDQQSAKNEIEQFDIPQAYLENLDLLPPLSRQKETYAEALLARPKIKRKILDTQSRIDNTLYAIGDDISADSLLKLEGIDGLMQEARTYAKANEDIKQRIRASRDRLENDQRPRKETLEKEVRDLELQIQNGPISDDQSLENKEEAIKDLKWELEAISEKPGNRNRGPLLFITAISILGFSWGVIATWNQPLLPYLFMGLDLFLIGIFLWQFTQQSTTSTKGPSAKEIHDQMEEIKAQTRNYQSLKEKLDEKNKKVTELIAMISSREDSLKMLEQKQQEAKERWEQQLEQYGLPLRFQPEYVQTDFAQKQFEVNQWHQEIQNLESELQEKERRIRSYEKTMASLPPKSDLEGIELCEFYIDQLNATKEEKEKRAQALQRLENIELQIQQLENQIKHYQQAIQDVLNHYDLENLNAYDERIELQKEYQEAVRNFQEMQTHLETLNSNSFSSLDQFIRAIHEADQFELKKSLTEINASKEEMESTISDLEVKTGELGQQIKQMESPQELQEKRIRLESHRAKMVAAVEQYLTSTLAARVLSQVKTEYEKENQPKVIQASRSFLSHITEGVYTDLVVRNGEKEGVILIDQNNREKTIGQLSRGTREQLLLALRLGLIEEYEREAEPLPLALDDIFVNFDGLRAQNTAEIISEFGQNRQILIFTCHRHTLDLFKGMDAHTYEMENRYQ